MKLNRFDEEEDRWEPAFYSDFLKMTSINDFDLLSPLTPEIRVLKLLGFWRSENKDSMYNSIFYKIYTCIVLLGMTLFQLFGYMHVYQKWRTISIDDITSVLFVYIHIFNIQTVITCIFLNMDRLHIIIRQLKTEVLKPKAHRHVEIAKRLKKSGDFVRKYYYGCCSFVLLVQPLLKLWKKETEPFFASYIPPLLGEIGVLVFQEVMVMFGGYACCNYVILDVNLMIAISIQIEILKDILSESDDINVIFELVNNVQHIFRIGMTIHFFTGVVVFCTTLFKILEVEVSSNEFMFLLPYTSAIILIIFAHCWFGNDIICRSADLTNAIFSSNWIGSNLATQKTIILFMTFNKEPLSIHLAGGLFIMAIPVFVSKWRTISIADITSVLFIYIHVFNIQTVITCVFLNMDRLHIIIRQLKTGIPKPKANRHVELAMRLKKTGDFVRKYYYASCSFVVFVQPLLKLWKKETEPFFATYVPPVLGDIGVLIFQEIMIVFLGYACCNYVILDINLMIGISIQIEILKDILSESDDINVIFECIKRHEQIVRLVKNVQHIFRIGMSIHFFTGVVIFCTTSFKLLEVEVDFNELMFLLPYSLAVSLILFAHCWFGNDIICRMLHEDLGMRKLCAKMVPKVLTVEQKELRLSICKDMISRIEEEGEDWMSNIKNQNEINGGERKKCIVMFDEVKLKKGLDLNKHFDFLEGYEDFAEHGRNAVLADTALVT
nr:unnamed protein product [Callosobruchus chinensis]